MSKIHIELLDNAFKEPYTDKYKPIFVCSKEKQMFARTIRVRFAPAPTGMMHIGNVRAALLNFLFARQKNGTFILRIEDTDTERNYDPGAVHIQADLAWLGLAFDEGPGQPGPFDPYFQSERTKIYLDYLQQLIQKKSVYRCFCTVELLEKKRLRQQALKQPPRYDRICLEKDQNEVQKLLAQQTPFVWRFFLDHNETIIVHDLGRGNVEFRLSNFSDFPVTRQDGSVTFLLANAVDDIAMKITHIFRGEDHLSNSALQGAIYKAFAKELPIYWHQPILCSTDGRKLSKRDFGFSLNDLREAGYLPEAITNYLGIIGSTTTDEIMSLEDLVLKFDFDHIHASGQITYDAHKLEWINHKWIQRKTKTELISLCDKLLIAEYGTYIKAQEAPKIIETLVETFHAEMKTIRDIIPMTKFYFVSPTLSRTDFEACVSANFYPALKTLTTEIIKAIDRPAEQLEALIKMQTRTHQIPLKEAYRFIRLCLMGETQGPGIKELFKILPSQEAVTRLQTGIALLN